MLTITDFTLIFAFSSLTTESNSDSNCLFCDHSLALSMSTHRLFVVSDLTAVRVADIGDVELSGACYESKPLTVFVPLRL